MDRWRRGVTCTNCGARLEFVVAGAGSHVIAWLVAFATSLLFPASFLLVILGNGLGGIAAFAAAIALLIAQSMFFASRATLRRAEENGRGGIVRWLTRRPSR